MPQVQLGTCILEMQELHCSIICFARHNDGDFIIRIEDTDQKRNIEDGEKASWKTLLGWEWIGMIS